MIFFIDKLLPVVETWIVDDIRYLLIRYDKLLPVVETWIVDDKLLPVVLRTSLRESKPGLLMIFVIY